LEQVDPADEPRSYRQQGFGDRMGVAVAGSAVHMILAFLLLVVLLTTVGIYGQPRAIKEFTENSAAEAAGLQVGDRIFALDGRTATTCRTRRRSRPARPVARAATTASVSCRPSGSATSPIRRPTPARGRCCCC